MTKLNIIVSKKYVYFMNDNNQIHKIKNVIYMFEGNNKYAYKDAYYDNGKVYITKIHLNTLKERKVSYPISKSKIINLK